MTKSQRVILESAILLFSRHGLGGTTLRDVAKHARVTPMTLYRGFKTMDDLVHEAILLVIERYFDESQLLKVLYEDSAKQELRVLLALLRWYAALPVPATKVLIYGSLSDNKKWRVMASEAIDKLTNILNAFISHESPKQSRSKTLARVIARSLLMVLLYMKMTSAEKKSAKRGTQEAAELKAILEYCLTGMPKH